MAEAEVEAVLVERMFVVIGMMFALFQRIGMKILSDVATS